MSHEEVVNKLDSETVAYDVSFGLGNGAFPELMRISIKVEPAKYEVAIAWIKDLLYGSVFDKERFVKQLSACVECLIRYITGCRSLLPRFNRIYRN